MSKAVIFDMDGVLVDTEPIYIQRFYEFFKAHNIDVDVKDIYRGIGTPDDVTFNLLGSLWNPKISGEEFREIFSTHKHQTNFTYKDLAFPHLHYLMKNLISNDIALGLASASPRSAIENVITDTKIKDFLHHTISGEEVFESKPNPEVYLQTMQKLQVKPEHTIIVEDSPSGIKAGLASGATVIAIKDNRFKLDQSGAHYFASDLMEVHNIILNHFNL